MYSVIQTGQGHGMQTMDQAVQRLVAQGLVSQKDAAAVLCENKNSINF
jgi:twitching motility protein PilT